MAKAARADFDKLVANKGLSTSAPRRSRSYHNATLTNCGRRGKEMQTELNTPTYSDLIVAYAHGKTLQFQDADLDRVGDAKNWNDLAADNTVVLPSLMRTDGKQSQRFNFRIKPRTVKIGDTEVDAPVLTPTAGQELWFVNTMLGCELESLYANDHVLVRARIDAGLCFISGAAAVAAHEAMTALLRGQF